ncbi:FAD-binding oxidoreductase [Microlunatus soli]|uniref:FAD/FMN-containing dehydrogenase n=1 Tax=Microlunatus soli TaxID=630515 RepID=A0A1H1U696_9ACTN|nr:FAD-binding oxidoreductase [Microlunatus soli]SDS67873.1 FAD/FMN-containing dehydrogenase [Microlunatus soli]
MTTALESLQQFTGDIIGPGDQGYEAASRTVFGAGQPIRVLCPATVRDVQDAVGSAAQAAIPLSVRGGGHSFAGFGTNEGGVVIDLRHLAEVQLIDPDTHRVRIGGGATWGQVSTALAGEGLAISAGDTRSVGVGGLTLSGGIGWKVRRHGLALDNLVAADVVLADGSVARASADQHPDLFWALRGGGGNVGIVTSFEFLAHPTTAVHSGIIAFPSTEATAVLQGWAGYLRDAPLELTSTVEFANPFAGGPRAPIQVHVVVDTDNTDTAAAVLEPIRRLGTVISDDVAVIPYADTLVDGMTPPPGIALITRSSFVYKGSVPQAISTLAEIGTAEGSPIIAIRAVGGAVAEVADDATAYAHRGAELMVATTMLGPDAVVAAAGPALDAVWRRLAPHVRGAYASFLSTATEQDVDAIYPSATRRRLAMIKRRYDPGNVFAGNHNVRPD